MDGGASDDFLVHLHRGSTLLAEDRVEEARESLELALSMQPQDARGQDLLAGVYFRLGSYAEALEIWQRLAVAYRDNATLRVNLALALFKEGHAEQALSQLDEALRIEPGNERAWGYRGLIHWRSGRLDAAKDDFLRAGRIVMARRMEDELDGSPGMSSANFGADTFAHPPAGEAVRAAAEHAMNRLEQDDSVLSVEAPTRHGEKRAAPWRPVELGAEWNPPRAHSRAPIDPPDSLRTELSRWTVELPEGVPFGVGSGGDLFVQTPPEVVARVDGLVAVQGRFDTQPVLRQRRGQELEDLLGGDKPLMRWHPGACAVIRPAAGERFRVLKLMDDVLYIRETNLVAFEGVLEFESASFPLGGEPVSLTQLHGSGAVVLSVTEPPKAVPVREQAEVRVDPDHLIGWTGRLFPNLLDGTAPYSAAAPPLSFQGDGVVLIR